MAGPVASRSDATPSTSKKKGWFTLAAVLLLPVLLGLLELGLRLAGVGYPTTFFIPKVIDSTEWLVENPRFGWRFFPPALARTPLPMRLLPRKPPGTFRIFLFGESAAMGDPRPAYGIGRHLEVLLRERYPHGHFEVVCVAMTAINSHAILPIARECAQYQGDLWILYLGNNEFAGPFGPSSVFGLKAPPIGIVRLYLASQRTRVGQLAAALARRLRTNKSTPASWDGLQMFLDQQLAPADPRKERVYRGFEHNLNDILNAGRKAGVPIILSSMASNLKDCGPFGSIQTAKPGTAAATSFEQTRRSVAALMERRQWSEALALCQKAIQQDAHFAEWHFWAGQCLLALTNHEAARNSFAKARDFDSLPFRADSKINQLLEEAGRGHATQSVYYVDAERALRGSTPNGIPGQESFYEHVHLSFQGNYRLALAFADEVSRLLPATLVQDGGSDWATADLCAQRLGVTDWNRASVIEEIIQRLADPPFASQCNAATRAKQLNADLLDLRQRIRSANQSQIRTIYTDALERRPNDHWLHLGYAEFLKTVGDLPGATAEMAKVRDLLPHHHGAYMQLGRLHFRQGSYAEARAALVQALERQPNLAEAHLELGQIAASQGKPDEALREYAAAQRMRPDDVAVHLLRARLFDQQNQPDQSIASLREALRLRPSSWEAHYLLGVQLVVKREFAQAQAHFETVIGARPDHALAHLNLGYVLASQRRFEAAIPHFRESLRLDPTNTQAREFLQTAERLTQGP